MPFITEELYQRLPRSPKSIENIQSICVAPYPEADELGWRQEVIEEDVEFIQRVVKAIRSARSDYNLPNKTKTEGKFQLPITVKSLLTGHQWDHKKVSVQERCPYMRNSLNKIEIPYFFLLFQSDNLKKKYHNIN